MTLSITVMLSDDRSAENQSRKHREHKREPHPRKVVTVLGATCHRTRITALCSRRVCREMRKGALHRGQQRLGKVDPLPQEDDLVNPSPRAQGVCRGYLMKVDPTQSRRMKEKRGRNGGFLPSRSWLFRFFSGKSERCFRAGAWHDV